MQTLPGIDCRGMTVAAAGQCLMERYNTAPPGASFSALLTAYPPGLRMWLLEVGARHCVEVGEDGAARFVITRGASPAQGMIPGVHHVVSAGDSIWTCERAHRVARIDSTSGAAIAVREVAEKASHLALDETAGRLFVADSAADAVIALRAADLSEIDRWPAAGGPHLPLVSPDGIVCVTGGATGTLTIARPATGRYVAQTIAVGSCPHDPLLDGTGAHAFVPCAGTAEIVKVRLNDGAVVGRCRAGAGPSHLVLHPDERRVFSANSWDGTLSCMTEDGGPLGEVASGGWAHAIDLSSDGRWVFVGNFLDDTLAVFDAATLERVALLPTDPYPHGVDVSPDARFVIATGYGSDHVRIFDAQTHQEIVRAAVGRGSSHSAFSLDCSAAWIGCSVDDELVRIDLGTGRVSGRAMLSRH